VDASEAGFQTLWKNKRSTLKSEYQTLVQQYPEAEAQLKKPFKVLSDIEDVARLVPDSVDGCTEWASIVNAAEEKGASYCKGLHGNPLFSDLYGTYAVTLQELHAVLKASAVAGHPNPPKSKGQQTTQEGNFQEVSGT
jgi:hypothetical protein